jgi:hypothetical protein
MALRITPSVVISLRGCRSSNRVLDDSGRCYVERGHTIRLHNQGGFGHNEQLVIEWQEHPDDNYDKSLTAPIGIAGSAGFTVDFPTSALDLGNYKAKIYTLDRAGYRSSSIAEAELAIENPDLAYHGYMSVDLLTQERLNQNATMKFAADAAAMHKDSRNVTVSNAVLFNSSGGDETPHDYSWNRELNKTHEQGMTAFLGISPIFFESGLEPREVVNGCVRSIIDHDGADEAEEHFAVFYRPSPTSPRQGTIPRGTVVRTLSGERFRTVSHAAFGPRETVKKVRVRPENVSTRRPGHIIHAFNSFAIPNNTAFDTSIKVKSECVPSRQDLDLRRDWRTRWREFQSKNGHLNNRAIKAGFYLDEPMWRQITNRELTIFTHAVKRRYRNRPLVVIEAALDWALNRLVLPEDVDWFGFDKYGLAPSSTAYKGLMDKAQALIAPHDHMKLIIVGDAFAKPGDSREYYDLARFTDRAVALGWFAWSLSEERGMNRSFKGLQEHIRDKTVPDNYEGVGLKRFHHTIGAAVLRTDH